MPLENQLLNNRYKLIAQIAAGGMALVYKAQDTMLNRIVAVKILRESFAEDPAFQKRFVREAQSAANLSHPNIVTVYDFGRDGDRQYIVMEYVEGRDLKSVIRAEGPLPLARALDIAGQICDGVGAAHRAGVVHCDVKPQNVDPHARGPRQSDGLWHRARVLRPPRPSAIPKASGARRIIFRRSKPPASNPRPRRMCTASASSCSRC